MQPKPGQIYWIKLKGHHIHPYIVSKVNSDKVLVSKITTNKKKSNQPGNIMLEPCEGNLEKQSVIDVADTSMKKVSDLGEYIGDLDQKRINQINSGINFLKRTYFKKN